MWLIFEKAAKPVAPPAAEDKTSPRRLEVATDAHTTVTVEADGEWSHSVQRLWGAECLTAIAKFSTNGQSSVQRTASIRVIHSGSPEQTEEAKGQHD